MIEKILKRKMIIIDVLCIIFGIAGIMYGIKQSKLRKDTIERLQGSNKALELKVDPGRSSSKLTKRGETREGDK